MAFQTYDAVANKEFLMDTLEVLKVDETPVYNKLKKVEVKSQLVEWPTDALAASDADNAVVEGADYTFANADERGRALNYTQLFEKTWKTSRTQEKVAKAAIASEFKYQLQKALREIKNDIDKALIVGTGNSGASGTARKMKGILTFIADNVETGTGTGNEALTETMLVSGIEKAWNDGGDVDTILTNGSQKKKITSFTSSVTRNVDASQNKLINNIMVYESDFGVLEVWLDRNMDTDKVAILQSDLWQVGVLYGVQEDTDIAANGHSKKGAIFAEQTLVSLQEKGNAKVIQLTV